MDKTATEDQQNLARLRDELACRKVLARYGWALNWRDPETLASIVWPDAVVDYGFFRGSGTEWVQAFMEIERAAGRPFHMLVCDQLEVKGDVAEAESLGIALTLENGDTAARQYWGRYLDQLHKRGEEWRISKRTYVVHGVFDVGIQQLGSGTIEGLHVATNLSVQDPRYRRFPR